MDLKKQFLQYWKGRGFAADKPFLLAVSGGVDSMVMCHLFLDAAIPFVVAHCNFGLRGAESDADEAAVTAWCAGHHIECFKTRFDTAAIVVQTKRSIQETARDLRYHWFEQIRKDHDLRFIVTAHHADDNAETMIMNMCRGTGIAGLHGIPERNGKIVRPLLFASREDIAAYAAENNIAFREDSSNKKDDYLRNAIRHHIMPLMEQYMPGAVYRIRETANRVLEAEQVYNKGIEKEKKRLLEQRGRDFYVPVSLLIKTRPLQTICYELFRAFNFTAAQTMPVLGLLQAETGRYIDSATHRIIRNRDFLVVTTIQPEEADLILIEDIPHSLSAGGHNYHFTFKDRVHDLQAGAGIAYIDASKIRLPLVLRKWNTGDYFYPLGMGMKKKKLSRFLTDIKVSAHEKKDILVLESDKRIVWVAGLRPDERFKVTDATQKIIKVEKQ